MIRCMETWRAIDTLRVVRTFADRPLDEAHLGRILQAGRRAGSAKNLQRRAFIVCRDRDHLAALSRVGDYAGHLAGAAVGIAIVTPEPESPGEATGIFYDVGLAAQNMSLAAWDLGVGSAPATVFYQDVARELLGYPEGRRCDYVLSFGYPADSSVLTAPKRPGGRRPLDELVHEERW
jgi:nitroreductase